MVGDLAAATAFFVALGFERQGEGAVAGGDVDAALDRLQASGGALVGTVERYGDSYRSTPCATKNGDKDSIPIRHLSERAGPSDAEAAVAALVDQQPRAVIGLAVLAALPHRANVRDLAEPRQHREP
ncbi:MAG: hypothetical protein JWQ20_2834 [Conexibacter sp.]|nr:hypothetical protein [Conexibacter sp.]